jgi:hypothetical protein
MARHNKLVVLKKYYPPEALGLLPGEKNILLVFFTWKKKAGMFKWIRAAGRTP